MRLYLWVLVSVDLKRFLRCLLLLLWSGSFSQKSEGRLSRWCLWCLWFLCRLWFRLGLPLSELMIGSQFWSTSFEFSWIFDRWSVEIRIEKNQIKTIKFRKHETYLVLGNEPFDFFVELMASSYVGNPLFDDCPSKFELAALASRWWFDFI